MINQINGEENQHQQRHTMKSSDHHHCQRYFQQQQQQALSNDLIRSGVPLRQSIRSLPVGQFEQIREMFDHRSKLKCHQTNVRIYTNRNSHQSSFHMASTLNYNTADPSRLWPVRAKPVLVKTLKMDADGDDPTVHHGWTQSSTSLSSTGYESNSSLSMISKRNSLATNLSSSTSSEDRQRVKSWNFNESAIETLTSSISSDDDREAKRFIVQTTSFPDQSKKNVQIHRWSHVDPQSIRRRFPSGSSEFQSRSSMHTPVIVHKQITVIPPAPAPEKPPRTFKHDEHYQTLAQSVSVPQFHLGDVSRSVSCVDLTTDADDKNIYEELSTHDSKFINYSHASTSTMKSTASEALFHSKVKSLPPSSSSSSSPLKKGISEPNLHKKTTSSPFFSPRGLINRFKRFLPRSSSKQSLNEKNSARIATTTFTLESDDSISTSSDNTDEMRLSRLDHVNRVQNVYDTLGSIHPIHHNFTESLTSTSLYDYVLHLFPDYDLSIESDLIRFKYPFDADHECTLKYFCFPDSSPFTRPNKMAPEYFRFTLTDMHGRRQHVYCSRFLRKGILNALCLISSFDLIDFYQRILLTATELILSYKDEDARRFLIELYPHRLPNPGDTIYIPTTTVGLYTLHCEYDRRKSLIDSTTLLNLSPDTIIRIFSSILYEQKVIFIGNELGPLTRLISTFLCLLYPFTWPHTYIPILPATMLDILQAPTPYIIGILRSCESYLAEHSDSFHDEISDLIIIDIDTDRIRSINDYLSSEYTHRLPSSHQILPKVFKAELKQELSQLKKNQMILSFDECQQRLRQVFMSIFIQSCYNYTDYPRDFARFLQSKSRTIELFLEWFTRTQIFQLFIREKSQNKQFAISFDLACENYRRTLNKQSIQRVTVKSVKRKAAARMNQRF